MLFPAPSTCCSSFEFSLSRIARCCCGALSAEAEGEPDAVVVCYCLECQRRTGSVFGVAAFFAAEAVQLSGGSEMYGRSSDAGCKLTFHFCPRCGTTVWWKTERHPGKIAIAAGAFADPDFPRPSRSVFNRSRYSWVDLPHDIPAHIAGRDSELQQR
jgi:hypothetical protein